MIKLTVLLSIGRKYCKYLHRDSFIEEDIVITVNIILSLNFSSGNFSNVKISHLDFVRQMLDIEFMNLYRW